jgi:hypothetical protein
MARGDAKPGSGTGGGEEGRDPKQFQNRSRLSRLTSEPADLESSQPVLPAEPISRYESRPPKDKGAHTGFN